MIEEVLGLKPAAPGFEALRVTPHLTDLEWAKGSVPTPRGVVSVSHTKTPKGQVATELDTPDGVAVVGGG